MNQQASAGFLVHPASNLIGGEFRALESPAASSTAEVVTSWDPSQPDRLVWSACARLSDIDDAVEAARTAAKSWGALHDTQRRERLLAWRDALAAHEDQIARLISLESGKILWESSLEAKALVEKVNITLDPVSTSRVSGYEFPLSPTRRGVCEFRPFGVMAVIGPFNFPAHLPNGHIVPALLAGNTIVFKPSEQTPAVGQLMGEISQRAGFPAGVFNVVQGGRATAAALVAHKDIDGILFTGSWQVGRRILESNLDRPGMMIALEMGGSNAAIVRSDCHMKQAIVECVRSAFASTGQRCTCTRRIIVDESIANEFITQFCKAASTLVIGSGDSADPVFMGPLISRNARDGVLAFQKRRAQAGDRVLLESVPLDRAGWFLAPGIIQRTRFDLATDEEVFGPIVQIALSTSDDDAIAQANATQFGLAGAVFTASKHRWEEIAPRLRAGCVNWNVATAGASSRLPFGGLGRSGNNRAAGAFSLDYCASPIAHLEESGDSFVLPQGMRPL